MRNQRSLLLTITVLAFTLCCITASVQAQTSPEIERKAFAVRPGGQLVLHSELGTINVKITNRNQVEIVYRKSTKEALDQLNREAFEDFDVTFRQSGADIYIEGKFKRGLEYWLKRADPLKLYLWHVSFEVTVPYNYHVDLKTGFGADIQVGNLGGTVTAETYGGDLRCGVIVGAVWGKTAGGGDIVLEGGQNTVNVETYGGDIELGNTTGDVKAKTAGGGKITLIEGKGKVDVETYGGDIEVGNVKKDAKAKTAGSGNISIGNVGGSLKAETYGGDLYFGIVNGTVWGKTAGGGNITLKGCHSKVNVETYGGYIHAEMTRRPRSQWILETASSGEIVATLVSNVAIDVDAHARSGSVSSDFRVQGSISKNSLKGTINGGGQLLKLRTSYGDIHLRRK